MDSFNIVEFPTEILEKIFAHFDDTTITKTAGVCKRFNDVLNHTVRRKYNGSTQNNWYEIEIFDGSMESDRHESLHHHPFILRRVSAIKLVFHTELKNQYHWIQQVLQAIGQNIKIICLTNPKCVERKSLDFYNILTNTPNISHLIVDHIYPTNRRWCHQRYKNLTHLEMRIRRLQFDDSDLIAFVWNNQLKNVKLIVTDFTILHAFNESKIESLSCSLSPVFAKDIPVRIRPIRMNYLKMIDLHVPNNAMNECIERIIALCPNLKDLCLVYFDSDSHDEEILTEQSMDILCNLRSLEKFDLVFHISLQNMVRLIANLPILVSITLQYDTLTIGDYRMLLNEANKHPRLRHIHFTQFNLFDDSVLCWLMDNINNQIEVGYSWSPKLTVTKGKVRYDGVTIMSSGESPIEYEKITDDWLEKTILSTRFNEQSYEFFSTLPIPKIQACFNEKENGDLHLRDGTNEAVVKRRGKYIATATTTFSSNIDKSVNHMNWLEKYCDRLRHLSIFIENNHPELPTWTFSELNSLRVHCQQDGAQSFLDMSLFASLKCLQLNCLKFLGCQPTALTNIQIVRNLDLFDNLAILQIFHFNESMENLLDQFNQNMQSSLQNLTLANRQVDGERYKMNNKTITVISKFTNLIQLKLILPAINKTNTKYLFERCTKLTELCFECSFLTSEEGIEGFQSYRIFADIKANCISLERLYLVWHDVMMDPYKVNGIKYTFPNVFVKILQINKRMNTTAEQIVGKTNDELERLFDEFQV